MNLAIFLCLRAAAHSSEAIAKSLKSLRDHLHGQEHVDIDALYHGALSLCEDIERACERYTTIRSAA